MIIELDNNDNLVFVKDNKNIGALFTRIVPGDVAIIFRAADKLYVYSMVMDLTQPELRQEVIKQITTYHSGLHAEPITVCAMGIYDYMPPNSEREYGLITLGDEIVLFINNYLYGDPVSDPTILHLSSASKGYHFTASVMSGALLEAVLNPEVDISNLRYLTTGIEHWRNNNVPT